MFCDRCGNTLNPTARFCTSCGKPVMGGAAGRAGAVAPTAGGAAPLAAGRVQRHLQLLAGLWLANGILRMVEVAWLVLAGHLFLPSLRGLIGGGDWPFAGGWGSWLSASLYSAGILLAGFGVVHLVLAWGLFERQPWARVLGLVIGFLALLRFPLGTALGIYTIWVLLPENSGREYQLLAKAS